jgi:hypothetical protein
VRYRGHKKAFLVAQEKMGSIDTVEKIDDSGEDINATTQ